MWDHRRSGVVYLVYLRDPRRVAEVGLVHLDAALEEAVPAMAGEAEGPAGEGEQR